MKGVFDIIFAFTKHNGKKLIGIDNNLPFVNKIDMDFYKYKTNGNILIMGHNTYKSYLKYLNGRKS